MKPHDKASVHAIYARKSAAVALCTILACNSVITVLSLLAPSVNANELPEGAEQPITIVGTTGTVEMLNSKRVMLESNYHLLPPIPLTALSESDFESLISSKVGYAILTVYGNKYTRTAKSSQYESQLRRAWENGATLKSKVVARLQILDEIEAYKKAKINANEAWQAAQNVGGQATYAYDVSEQERIGLRTAIIREDDYQFPGAGLLLVRLHQQNYDKASSKALQLGQQEEYCKLQALYFCRFAEARLEDIKGLGLTILDPSITRPYIIEHGVPNLDPNTGLPLPETNDPSLYNSPVAIGDPSPLPKIPSLVMKDEVDETIKSAHSSVSLGLSRDPQQNAALETVATNSPELDAGIVRHLIQYADSGVEESQYKLGLRFLQGRGITKDYAKGVSYLKKAAAQGNTDAIDKLKTLGENP